MQPEELGKDEHLRTAERFFALATKQRALKDDDDAKAWTIVLDFYAAVHWLRAYVRKKKPGATIASHDNVRDFFDDMPELLKIKKSYDLLKQSSQAVRYYGQFAWKPTDYETSKRAAAQVRDWSVPLCKRA